MSWPFLYKAGLSFAYTPGEEYGMGNTGPFMTYSNLDSAVKDLSLISKEFRQKFEIWQAEGRKFHLDIPSIPYGIRPEIITREKAVAFWSKLTGFPDDESRYEYLAKLGGRITLGNKRWFYNPQEEHLKKTGGGLTPFEYGTVFLETIKLVKEMKPRTIELSY